MKGPRVKMPAARRPEQSPTRPQRIPNKATSVAFPSSYGRPPKDPSETDGAKTQNKAITINATTDNGCNIFNYRVGGTMRTTRDEITSRDVRGRGGRSIWVGIIAGHSTTIPPHPVKPRVEWCAFSYPLSCQYLVRAPFRQRVIVHHFQRTLRINEIADLFCKSSGNG